MKSKKKSLVGFLYGLFSIFVVSSVVMGTIVLGTSGCVLQPEQVKVIAQNAGLFSAVGWIAADNPEQGAVDAVKLVVDVIVEKASAVQAGQTYTEAIYPFIQDVIGTDVIASQYKPICS
ncbi:MAG: hypothetical protein WC375_09450, partial [Methanomassiliicoccales archaeon]